MWVAGNVAVCRVTDIARRFFELVSYRSAVVDQMEVIRWMKEMASLLKDGVVYGSLGHVDK